MRILLDTHIERLVPAELQLIDIKIPHLNALPFIHKDPFDRLLIAQPEAEDFRFLTDR